MAAVTINNASSTAQRHVLGDVAVRYFNVSGASGSTLNTGLTNILFVSIQQSNANGTISVITAMNINTTTGVITFTSSGTMTNEVIAVEARQG